MIEIMVFILCVFVVFGILMIRDNRRYGRVFIDDEREPVDSSLVVIRSMNQFYDHVARYGCPFYITFDHDLGHQQPTGYDIAKWMVDKDLDKNGKFIPKNFSFDVHSQNPVGAANIQSLLDNYLHRGR
ncbi:MAG: cyclic-phosphate processing receiver domain-containing protein [Candidimonas sp.]